MQAHQYIHRQNKEIMTEQLFADRIVNWLYSKAREQSPALFRAATSAYSSRVLGFINFDLPFTHRLTGNKRFLKSCGVDLRECVNSPESFTTPRSIFERKIQYWAYRPQPIANDLVVSPADARLLVGSFQEQDALFIKNKFFDREELLGRHKQQWLNKFEGGDFAIFRLTPDKYHYNHTPVAGTVVDYYELSGTYHSCNPGAVVELVTPYSKNKRVVTIIQTDVPGGTGVGLVAMIEVVALMIGDIVQCYSEREYDNPKTIEPGLFIKRGQPKSLYRPGSSTDILIFEKNRIRFSDDIINNQTHPTAFSRFTQAFESPLVETDVDVRSAIAHSIKQGEQNQ